MDYTSNFIILQEQATYIINGLMVLLFVMSLCFGALVWGVMKGK